MSWVALVTAAGSGSGKAVAIALAETGVHVAVADHDPDAAEATVIEITEVGDDAAAITMDTAHSGSIATAIATAEERLGPIDVLVHLAVGLDRRGDDSRVLASRRVVSAVLPGMTARGRGRVIVVDFGPPPVDTGLEVGPGTTGSVVAFVAELARELATTGVTANTVRVDLASSESSARPGDSTDQVPDEPIGAPRDVAGVVSFLAAEDSSFVSGETLTARA